MLAPLLALAMMQQPRTVPEGDRGSRLYRDCRATVRFSDGTDSGADTVLSASCVAYINGFLDGVEMADNHAICVGGASLGTLARVYVAYMAANPKAMDSERSVGLTAALLQNYACPLPVPK
jgi:hypothetical protein